MNRFLRRENPSSFNPCFSQITQSTQNPWFAFSCALRSSVWPLWHGVSATSLPFILQVGAGVSKHEMRWDQTWRVASTTSRRWHGYTQRFPEFTVAVPWGLLLLHLQMERPRPEQRLLRINSLNHQSHGSLGSLVVKNMRCFNSIGICDFKFFWIVSTTKSNKLYIHVTYT